MIIKPIINHQTDQIDLNDNILLFIIFFYLAVAHVNKK